MKSLNHFDKTINQALQDWRIPGAAVALIKGDQTLHLKGHGFRNIEQGLPVTEHTRFPIASMTKPFTALGAAVLVEEGLLNWDQAIRDVLPDFRLYDDYATSHATLRDLLSHRTGLPRHDATWHGTGKTRQALFDGLRHLKPNADFRSLWQYNNLMYEVIGLLCAKVSGADSWEYFIQSRVIDPLGLSATTAKAEPEGSARFTDVALPYRLKSSDSDPIPMPVYKNPLGPAGSIHSTLSDLVAWIKVHAHGGMSNGQQLVSPENLAVMHAPHMIFPATAQKKSVMNNVLFAYGLGWFIEPYQGVTLYHHGGNIGGFSHVAAFVPQEEIALVVLSNIRDKPMAKALMYHALDVALGIDPAHTKNWSAEFLKLTQDNEQEAKDALAQSAADKVKNAPASHALDDYAGTYTAPGYADILVKYEDIALSALYAGEWYAVHHYHYDVFELDREETYGDRVKFSFALDNSGSISALNYPIEPEIGTTCFTRLHKAAKEPQA
ncbi:FmtA-like protein [Gammaproteobacteria bacterium MOLA455]|nr:FmtA-like protein [Gammaproteobacteria bacterium MOLA455]